MNNRGKKIIIEKLIEPFFMQKPRNVGVELEYPVIPTTDGYDTRMVSSSLLSYFIKEHGFTERVRGSDGLLVRIQSPEGDCISFDLHYSQIEFSMWHNENFTNIASRFYRLLKYAVGYFEDNGHILSGVGTNLKIDLKNIHYTADDFTRYIKAYMQNYTYYKNPDCIFCNMFSTQTHMNIDGGSLIDALNLLQRLGFAHGILFSNSLPCLDTLPKGKAYPQGTLCARDFNWEYSDFPSTGSLSREFKNIDDLADYINECELFLDIDENGRIIPINKISIKEYFENPKKPDENLSLFRMFSHTAINHYSTIEVRSDCIQPISEAFAPSAFHTGILYDAGAASEAVSKFFSDNKISNTNAELRKMAVTGQKITEDNQMVKFLNRLYDIAYNSLVQRGYGEETFIECLKERIETLSCPARFMRGQLQKGVTFDEMLYLYGKLN